MFKIITFAFLIASICLTSCTKSQQDLNQKDKTKHITYHEHSNQIQEEVGVKNGKYEGKYKLYYENGHIKMEAFYLNGKMHGLAKKYYENGKVKADENYFRNKLVLL